MLVNAAPCVSEWSCRSNLCASVAAPPTSWNPPLGFPIATSQVHPYVDGVCVMAARLAPKTYAPVIAATATVTVTSAARTGTAVRPRPGSTARRTPTPAETGRPRRTASRPSRDADVRDASGELAVSPRARRHAEGKTHTSESATMRIAPAMRTGTSTYIPACGSARRAKPTGVKRDAATANRAAPAATTSAIIAVRASDIARI